LTLKSSRFAANFRGTSRLGSAFMTMRLFVLARTVHVFKQLVFAKGRMDQQTLKSISRKSTHPQF